MIEKIGVETPPSMVNNYLNNILEDVKKQNNGEKIDEEKVLETYRPSAERNLKWYLIRKKIIDQEQISIGRSDIDTEIENLVSRSPNSEKDIQKSNTIKNPKINTTERLNSLTFRLFFLKIIIL